MLALRSSPPSFGAAEAERIARDHYGLVVSARPLPGERDSNFRLEAGDGREFVLKIFDLAAGAESIDCLVRVLGHVAEQDSSLPAPRLLPTQLGLEVGRFERQRIELATCLLSFLPGRLLARTQPSPVLLQNTGALLGRLDRALQGFFHPTLNRQLAWDVRRLPQLMEFSALLDPATVRPDVQTVSEGFRACLPRLRAFRSQAIHGDCHCGNLIMDSSETCIAGILDFGDMIHAPVIFEPAVAMSELMTENLVPLQATADLLHGFAREQALRSDEVEMLFELVTARHAVTLLVHAWRRQYDPAGAELLEEAAAHAGRSLHALLRGARAAIVGDWHSAAGTGAVMISSPAKADLLGRRHRLMGSGAELFYDQPLHLVRGAGVWLYDRDGHAYLDVYNNVPHVGHSHPTVVRAIQEQVAILATHTRYLHEKILEYAEELTARLPAHLDACIFVNSGSEANDVAWRMAQMTTGRHGALVMQHAYHGITDAVAALTPGLGQPRDPRVVTVASPPAGARADEEMTVAELCATAEDLDRAVSMLHERGLSPAAFFIDTAITSSGIFDPPPAWAAVLQERVRSAGGLIVADEVQYGLGRSGSHLWGFERRGLIPDIVTLGKPVANGYPMGVVVARRALVEEFQAKFGFFSTFGGNAVAAAAALAVFRVLDAEALMGNASATGAYLRGQLQSMAARHACLGQVRGAGLLLGLEVIADDRLAAKRRTKRIINALASGPRVLIGYEGPHANVLKLRPPLPFRREHADLLVTAIDAAATALDC